MGGFIYGLFYYGDDIQQVFNFVVVVFCLKYIIFGDVNLVIVVEVEKLMFGDVFGRVS